MHNTTGVQFHDHENADWPEEQVMYEGEITGPDVWEMVLEKCGPGLTCFLVAICEDILLDGALADRDPQVQQLTTDSFGTPGQVFSGHLLDERDRFRREVRLSLYLGLWISSASSGGTGHDASVGGFRLHDVKCLLPETGQSGQPNQAHTVSLGQLWTFDLPIEHDQLLSQERILCDQILAATF
jgi:hypothetical protein